LPLIKIPKPGFSQEKPGFARSSVPPQAEACGYRSSFVMVEVNPDSYTSSDEHQVIQQKALHMLFAHHVGFEVMGREFAPETTGEHLLFFGVALVVVTLMAYGAYAAVRDFRRWRRER
jgi:hypothetical protein